MRRALAHRIADDIAAMPIRLMQRNAEGRMETVAEYTDEPCDECGGTGFLPDSMGLDMDTPCWRCAGEAA